MVLVSDYLIVVSISMEITLFCNSRSDVAVGGGVVIVHDEDETGKVDGGGAVEEFGICCSVVVKGEVNGERGSVFDDFSLFWMISSIRVPNFTVFPVSVFANSIYV